MSLKLGDVFPNMEFDTTEGKHKFHDWLGDSWGILFSHPADYTPVCTTELGAAAKAAADFKQRGMKMIGFSIDSVEDHHGWIKDIQCFNDLNGAFPFPLIAGTRKQATDLGMLDPDELDKSGMPLTARCVFIIGPDKKLKLSLLYPATTGRNFDEILRVVDSLQLTAHKKVATPANWKSGDKCMVVPSLSNEEATKLFPKGFETAQIPSKKTYIRLTPDPSK